MRAIAWTMAGLLFLAGCQSSNVRTSAGDAAVVRIDSGTLAGERADGIDIYRGVPYAAAPVGERRWAAPAPMPAWQGTRAATAFGASCPQPVVPPPFGVED